MATHTRSGVKRTALLMLGGACLGTLVPAASQFLGVVPAVQAQPAAQTPLAKPPEGQTFMGAKNCSACHLDQYLDWRETKHAKAFEILPAKYREDASCLKCHTTGFGEASGFKNMATTAQLAATTCESCHGPGSKHGEIAKSFGQKKLSKEEESYVRSTIYRMQPKNVCVECHLDRAHKKHPPYMK